MDRGRGGISDPNRDRNCRLKFQEHSCGEALRGSAPENGIWEQGEAWEFVIQGYSNSSGLFASEFNSIGIDSSSSSSSGSIVAIVPEPGVPLLSLLSLGCMLAARRRYLQPGADLVPISS